MTYTELHQRATTWTARHVAQDLRNAFGNSEAAPLDIAMVSDWQEKEGGERIPTPKVFPTEGPRSMQYVAYDPETMDVCGDEDCRCRKAKGCIHGYGATASEALADFWEQIDEHD